MNLETQVRLIFKWPDGSNVSSDFWGQGQPDNNVGKQMLVEGCVRMGKSFNYSLGDISCNNLFNYFCEYN